MKITITIEDVEDGKIKVNEDRESGGGEASVTSASALADAMLEVMDQLGEVAEQPLS